MKRGKVYFCLLLLTLAGVVTWSAHEMMRREKTEEPYMVSVIVSNSNSDRWTAMREGIEQAARDSGTRMNYISTGKIISAEEELTLIQREIAHGADGVLVQMTESEVDMWSMDAVSADTALVLLETDVNPKGRYLCVKPDNYGIGTAIAGAVKEDCGASLAGRRLGILAGNQNQEAMQERLAGFSEAVKDAGAEVVWQMEEPLRYGSSELRFNQTTFPADIIIALGDAETELAADYLAGVAQVNEVRCALYGAGCSGKNVYYLDKGLIQRLVVPNEFHMGYLGMNAVLRQLDFPLAETVAPEMDYLVVDRASLYDAENQKVLFPIVQ